jgi:hypothetical protein
MKLRRNGGDTAATKEVLMSTPYTYEGTLAAAERIHWRVEDLIGGDKRLDFDKPFLPESLARVEPLSFLSGEEKRVLNQIRAHGYLYTFGLVEEFILPFVLDHARPQLDADDYRVRALLRFACEEAKHIHLFKCFRREFEAGFGTACEVIGPPREIARNVLSHHPLAVALVILQIEWMTQRHYVESVRDDHNLDEQFKSLLRHHWMEEAQHAKLDTLMVESLASTCGAGEIDTAFDEYAAIGELIDGGLQQQARFDLDAFERASGRRLNADERDELYGAQRQALRWTFLGSGMSHERFLSTVEALRPAARTHIEEMTAAFS